ncbi:PEP-CTERM sorting domain-containing protein [Haloferula sp.]|uniref:PEP-CTERM sorting domain-containing protein n=1 Tax=Haloferula sp. TaxID=2497595 RepID=UPI0032A0776C
MKQRIAPLLGGIICASSLSLSAQTFTEDNSATPAVNTFNRVDGYTVGEVIFNNAGGVPDPFTINPLGMTITEVTTDSGLVRVYDVCAEMFVGPNDSSSYSVSEGFGALNATQQLQIAKLFSNTLIDFINYVGSGDTANANVVGAAIQMAFWEIIEDPVAQTTPSLDDLDVSAGNISIVGLNTDYTGEVDSAVNLAQTYLTSLATWEDEGGLSYYYSDPGAAQDRLWVGVGASVIPEPSTALLSLLGLGFLLRRKRN